MQRIKQIREARGKTQQQVADALGMHVTNYNKLENGVTELTFSRMEEIANILHCQPTDLISQTAKTRHVKVCQHVEAGIWSETHIWPESDWYEVAIPDDAEYSGVNLYAAETRGPSMNKRYPERSALIYTSVYDVREKIEPGKRYIVEIERPDGMREATVKTLFLDSNNEYWLLPESTDPRHQSPIRLEGDNGDTIRIVGRVRYTVLKEE